MDVLDAYKKAIADKYRLPDMQHGGLEEQTESFGEADAVWSRLSALSPTWGWLQFQSEQRPFLDGLPEPDPDWGVLLAAEAVTAQGDSVSVTLDGAGGWQVSRICHQAEGDYLCDEVHQLTRDPGVGTLRYRRYWRLDPAEGYVQERACFIGFE